MLHDICQKHEPARVIDMELSPKIMKDFEAFCKEQGITGKKRDEKLAQLKQLIEKYQYEPGEAIGVVAAQSISEPATQMTMRSYTLASQSDRLSKVTQGLPRLIEIFDARKTFEKNMVIYLKPAYNDKNKAKECAAQIKEAKIVDLITADSIDLVNMAVELELEDETYRDEMKKQLEKSVKGATVQARGKKIVVSPKTDDVKNLRKIKNKLMKLHIAGTKSIENVVVVREGDEWVIQTTGSNLKKVLSLDFVDVVRTRTNDTYQVREVLGIEAARNAILRESKETLDEQGLDVDIRHLMLLADMMTFSGEIRDIGRYGVAGKKVSVLARANFEETKKHLINASFFGETDILEGIIENVIVGQIAPVGTGMVRLTVDMDKMRKGMKKQ